MLCWVHFDKVEADFSSTRFPALLIAGKLIKRSFIKPIRHLVGKAIETVRMHYIELVAKGDAWGNPTSALVQIDMRQRVRKILAQCESRRLIRETGRKFD
jgi:hypothetical protein